MKKAVLKIISISILLIFFISTTGFNVYYHICECGKMTDVSYFFDATECSHHHLSDNAIDPNENIQHEIQGNCHHLQHWFKLKTDFNNNHQDDIVELPLVILNLPYIFDFEEKVETTDLNLTYCHGPPLRTSGKFLIKLYQQFKFHL